MSLMSQEIGLTRSLSGKMTMTERKRTEEFSVLNEDTATVTGSENGLDWRPLKVIWANSTALCLQLDQIAQNPIQPNLE